MARIEDTEERNTQVMRIGLTISVKILRKIKRLYLASSDLLFPFEISFADFVNLMLKSSTYGIFPEVPKEIEDETTFYSLRIPSDLREETLEPLNGGKKEIWKDHLPIDYNQFVKNQFLRCTTDEGALAMLVYIWYLKLILKLLEKKDIDQEAVLKKGSLPEIPELYAQLNNVLRMYLMSRSGAIENQFKRETEQSVTKHLGSSVEKLTDAIAKVNEEGNEEYVASDIGNIISSHTALVSVFTVLLGIPDSIIEMNGEIITPDEDRRRRWLKTLTNVYLYTIDTVSKISKGLR